MNPCLKLVTMVTCNLLTSKHQQLMYIYIGLMYINCIYVAKHMSCAHHVMLDQNTLIHNTLQDSHTVLQCKCVKGNDIIYKKLFTRPLLTWCQTIWFYYLLISAIPVYFITVLLMVPTVYNLLLMISIAES